MANLTPSQILEKYKLNFPNISENHEDIEQHKQKISIF